MFGIGELKALEKATQIAEEVTTDHFSLSSRDWARSPFFVDTISKTNRSVKCPQNVFAHLVYFGKDPGKKNFPRERNGYYKIFVNDPKIIDWLKNRPGYGLLPLLTYVMTHELVHIARFLRFHCHPLTNIKDKEEKVVHELTYNILKPVKMDGLHPILEYFNNSERRFSHANL